ncbi:uncharacterized protein LOC135102470 [Scylla paramamosain]|uniref:uncharacterized protein LOC135102470 n=1 Tax=Scylla paramamosain TaxID=85552 RepID=UPI00308336B1
MRIEKLLTPDRTPDGRDSDGEDGAALSVWFLAVCKKGVCSARFAVPPSRHYCQRPSSESLALTAAAPLPPLPAGFFFRKRVTDPHKVACLVCPCVPKGKKDNVVIQTRKKISQQTYKEINARQCRKERDKARDDPDLAPVNARRPTKATGRHHSSEGGDRGGTTEGTEAPRGKTERENTEESDTERSERSESEGPESGGSDTYSNDSNDKKVGDSRGEYAAVADPGSKRRGAQAVRWHKKARMPRSETEEVIEVRDMLDLPPSVKASLSAWGSRSSFHSFRIDSNDRYESLCINLFIFIVLNLNDIQFFVTFTFILTLLVYSCNFIIRRHMILVLQVEVCKCQPGICTWFTRITGFTFASLQTPGAALGGLAGLDMRAVKPCILDAFLCSCGGAWNQYLGRGGEGLTQGQVQVGEWISILGDFNVHHQLWLSSPFTDHPGVLAFNFAIFHDLGVRVTGGPYRESCGAAVESVCGGLWEMHEAEAESLGRIRGAGKVGLSGAPDEMASKGSSGGE